jgi:Ni,Fe-hydrogenase III small subunit
MGNRKVPLDYTFQRRSLQRLRHRDHRLPYPRYDLERVGILKQGSPRHADILVCTGAVTLQTRDRLIQIYEQMSDPKFVIAIGTCACTGGIFEDCYCVTGGIDSVIPVDVYLPGCAVRPEAIISAVDKLLASLKDKESNPENKEEKAEKTDNTDNEEKSVEPPKEEEPKNDA